MRVIKMMKNTNSKSKSLSTYVERISS